MLEMNCLVLWGLRLFFGSSRSHFFPTKFLPQSHMSLRDKSKIAVVEGESSDEVEIPSSLPITANAPVGSIDLTISLPVSLFSSEKGGSR